MSPLTCSNLDVMSIAVGWLTVRLLHADGASTQFDSNKTRRAGHIVHRA